MDEYSREEQLEINNILLHSRIQELEKAIHAIRLAFVEGAPSAILGHTEIVLTCEEKQTLKQFPEPYEILKNMYNGR